MIILRINHSRYIKKRKEANKALFLVYFDLILSVIYAIKNNRRIDEFYRADQKGKKN